ETQEMLDFCSKHNIECEIELIPIQKVNEAYDRAVKSDVRYRFVIDIKSL
ncbi:MAG: NAD(P)-dependent alcohol dehydrogenase, partial [Bacteriovoracales bacterium]